MKNLLIKTLMILGILIVLPINIVKAEEIGNKAFDDVNFYKCVVEAYNEKNKTQKKVQDNLTDEELQTITVLSCSGYQKQTNEKITSAKGLEKLTELTYLNLGYNNYLSEIDVRKNTKLTTLYLGSNKLSKIDLSKNTELKTLDLWSNDLNEIDIKANTKLTTLNLFNNNLSEIDVRQNTKLTELRLYNNNLSEIDVSNNTVLQWLDLGGNNLSEIDVKANTLLTTLDLSYNELSEIDVSNNTVLQWLELDGNSLSEIDVSNNTELQRLKLDGNNLSEIDVSQNTKLTNLSLSGSNINKIDVTKNTLLKALYLNNNKFSEIDVKANTELTILDLNNNKLSEIDVSPNTKLEILELGHNNINKIDVSLNKNLKYLGLSKNKLNNINLINNTNLESIDLENNHFLSLNLSYLPKLKNGFNHTEYSNYYRVKLIVSPQSRTLTIYNDRKLNLKEYDSNLDPSKVVFTPIDGVTYDNKTGVFTFIKEVEKISYIYKTGMPSTSGVSEDMEVNLKLNYSKEDNPNGIILDEYVDQKTDNVQTGAITIGVITIVGMLTGLTCYIIVKRKNKLYKL